MSLTDNLVAWWKLDGNGDNAVSASYAVTNNGADWVAGKIGQAADLEVTESDHLKTLAGYNFGGGSALSIAGWIKLESTGSEMSPICIGTTTNGVYGLWFRIIRTQGRCDVLMSNQTVGRLTPSPFSAGSWGHFAVAYDGSAATDGDRLKMYINGAIQSITHPTAVPVTISANAIVWSLGSYISQAGGGARGEYFDGLLDMMGVWGRAITSAEVAQLYNLGVGIDYPFASAGGAPISRPFSPAFRGVFG